MIRPLYWLREHLHSVVVLDGRLIETPHTWKTRGRVVALADGIDALARD